MNDNRTTELLMREFVDVACECEVRDYLISEYAERIEQAVAATLGSDKPPYDELLRCLENDWHISASWDGLRKFWCVELTEEGVRMRDARAERGTLTAEQVREAIEANSWAETSSVREFNDSSWQAIADELNARAERTCEYAIKDNMNETEGMGDVWFRCTNCDMCFDYADDWLLKMPYCPHCGARVKARNE